MYSLLIVDDEEIILNGIGDAVKASGLPLKSVQTAGSSRDALAILEKTPCDILLSDIRMPDMDGLEMVSRAKEIWPDIKIIFLSGYQDFEYARAALRLKSQDFLVKPSTDKTLLEAIGRVITALDSEWMQRFETRFGAQEEYEGQWMEERNIRMIFLTYEAGRAWMEQQEIHNSLCGMLTKILGPYCLALRSERMEDTVVFLVQPSLEEMHWENGIMKLLEEMQSFFLEQLDIPMSIGVSGKVKLSDKQNTFVKWRTEFGAHETFGKLILMNREGEAACKEDKGDIEDKNNMESKNYVVHAIYSYVQDNPENDLSLGTLSERFRMNPSYLSRIFHQEMGQPLSEYILQVRMEEAKRLLCETELKIYEIAEKAGFGTPGYFTKVFHRSENMSPKNYRITRGIFEESKDCM